ncbi:MAG: 50S ribosomal protein L35 [candidate division WOR-3 bacterium]|nr:MAG: 50S ribosomal protein L35 [candidate division WOR-3 bacterium]
MAKQKTKRALAKRVKKKKSGVIMRSRAGKGHLLTGKTKKRKRRLRQKTTISKSDAKKIKGLI